MEEIVRKIEELIRTARVREARRELARFRTEKVPREFVLPIAKFCRTTNLPELGIRLLNPYVRPSVKSVVTAKDSEKAVYAACLIRIGAVPEARSILKGLNSEVYPECMLYEAFALISQWNYKESVPLLKRYVKHTKVDAYQKLVGEVNLAAAYVHEQINEEAIPLLAKLREETKTLEYFQLLGNALELSAQQAIFSKDWKAAEKFLFEAGTTLKKSGGLDSFFVEKWEAIKQSIRSPKQIQKLGKIRQEAKRLKHWETIRDCDRFGCKATKKEELFQKVYFGTPFPEFRTQLTQEFKFPLPKTYVWYPFGQKNGPVLDLTNFKTAKNSKAGMLLHRLLILLCSDFYRPIRLATIHSSLYEGEHFNPRSSPVRVHQAIKRLRLWLKKNRFPLEIVEDRSSYALKATAPVGVKIALHLTPPKRQDFQLSQLKDQWGVKPFSAPEAAEHLKVSLRSVNRLLKLGETEGKLTRHGKASATRYRF